MRTILAIALLAAASAFAQTKWKNHGAISCYGRGFGGVYGPSNPNPTGEVQYWMSITLWNNFDNGTVRDVQPGDVKIYSAQEPIVTKTNGNWVITFKP